jgi:hypothetical protein
MADISARAALSEAIRYWEPRRIAYNVILFLEVVALYLAHLPTSRSKLDFNLALAIFVLAVLANVAYCAAYLVDVPAQLSAFRANWLRARWVLALIGITFAAVLTYFFSLGFFA